MDTVQSRSSSISAAPTPAARMLFQAPSTAHCGPTSHPVTTMAAEVDRRAESVPSRYVTRGA
ncbi:MULTISPECIES: hypothetical protein [Streptomyces]|uniref:hypothetical protein n=1 Tax=Streptomyces TaxID=1883 RepID=UPI00131BDECF